MAAAVARFDKDEPVGRVLAPRPARREAPRRARSFASTSGSCSSGCRDLTERASQLRQAQAADDPHGFYGRQAARVLKRLDTIQ